MANPAAAADRRHHDRVPISPEVNPAFLTAFGTAIAARIREGVGEPEDAVRGPLENLLTSICGDLGVSLVLHGEVHLAEVRAKPDYAARVDGAVVGHIEVKAPGKGADPRTFSDRHDREQWEKLQALPNLLYTDGNQWALCRAGQVIGDVVILPGDVRQGPAGLADNNGHLRRLLADFFGWEPLPPRSAQALAWSVAGLCRLLREDVRDRLDESEALQALADDWRQLLFPEADDDYFADQYAQTVTFGLLLARSENIDVRGETLQSVATALGNSHSLIGKALAVLTDDLPPDIALSVEALVRVIGAVDWAAVDDADGNLVINLYEVFLSVYDPQIRARTGSYYTPAPVVTAMVNLTDEILSAELGYSKGLASEDVKIVDPALGTGTFLLAIIDRIAARVTSDEGEGMVASALAAAAERLIGFEKQTGPYAVADMRVSEALRRRQVHIPQSGLRVYVADTLDDPNNNASWLPHVYAPIAKSRRDANHVKLTERVVVVIGNPPYRNQARHDGGWVENGHPGEPALLRDFIPVPTDNAAPHVRHIYNLYVYFWRWALWKVFEQDRERDGVIAFITASGWLSGPGFVAMRRKVLSQSSHIWVIDLEGDNRNGRPTENVFAIQTPVSIVIATRKRETSTMPCEVQYTVVTGTRQEKLETLGQARHLDSFAWTQVSDPERTMLPGDTQWETKPLLHDLMPTFGVGVTAGRTWVAAPDRDILTSRWRRLIDESDIDEKRRLLREHHNDRLITTEVNPLPGHNQARRSLAVETSEDPDIVRFGYRSFDRQWIIADNRVINRPNPRLWSTYSASQVYACANKRHAVTSGPAITFSAYPPDNGYHRAAGGEYVLPFYLDTDAQIPNLRGELLRALSGTYGFEVTAEDVFAYIAGIAGHPGYTTRFHHELSRPGVRIPITSNGILFDQVQRIGRKVVWLHTFGERFADPSQGRPHEAPRLPEPITPKVTTGLPSGSFPNELTYDESTLCLHVGGAVIMPVQPEVWLYEVSGMRVLQKWFSYRKQVPARRGRPNAGEQSPLDSMHPTSWPHSYTAELLEVLRVLTALRQLEEGQDQLLAQVMSGGLLLSTDLRAAGVDIDVSLNSASAEALQQDVLF